MDNVRETRPRDASALTTCTSARLADEERQRITRRQEEAGLRPQLAVDQFRVFPWKRNYTKNRFALRPPPVSSQATCLTEISKVFRERRQEGRDRLDVVARDVLLATLASDDTVHLGHLTEAADRSDPGPEVGC